MTMDNLFCRLWINELQNITCEYRGRMDIKHSFNKMNQMARRDFIARF